MKVLEDDPHLTMMWPKDNIPQLVISVLTVPALGQTNIIDQVL